jgi:hypothetical protein
MPAPAGKPGHPGRDSQDLFHFSLDPFLPDILYCYPKIMVFNHGVILSLYGHGTEKWIKGAT